MTANSELMFATRRRRLHAQATYLGGLVNALAALAARDAAARMRGGEFTARAYAQALLAQVHARERDVQAWAFIDEGYVLAQADTADQARREGRGLGPLHGVPVGIKDIIDTAALPTENGTALHAGRQPGEDAAVVTRLLAAGGIVMGKTVTTELATYAPGKTRNPHNLAHTPGGSSSGSAAAVAAGMVPLAIGTQTNGSVLRPAAFCGVVGYKPTFGWISRAGGLSQSPAFDQFGVFARDVEDAALLAECLVGHDPRDDATRPRGTPPLATTAASEPPVPPLLGLVRTPAWDRVDADAQQAFMALAGRMPSRVVELEWPAHAGELYDLHRLVMEADIAASFDGEYERGRDRLSASLRSQIERGREVTAVAYRRALERRIEIASAFDRWFAQVDALITPATLGTAPHGLASTGNPIMCTPWTFTGQPAVTLPLLQGANGLPLGVQLVGRRDGDARLLRTAAWLERTVRQ